MNTTLIGTDAQAPATFNDTEKYRDQMKAICGSDDVPAIIYKGISIPAGKLGQRKI